MNGPIAFFGLADSDGNFSFNKLVTVAIVALLFVIVETDYVVTASFAAFGSIALCAGFGLKGVALWLRGKSSSGDGA